MKTLTIIVCVFICLGCNNSNNTRKNSNFNDTRDTGEKLGNSNEHNIETDSTYKEVKDAVNKRAIELKIALDEIDLKIATYYIYNKTVNDRRYLEKDPYFGCDCEEMTIESIGKNGYKFEGTREADYGRDIYPDDAIADFLKKISLANDNFLKVSIHFNKTADYKNFEKNEDGDNIYVGNQDEFIISLVEETQAARGGTRQKNRKTRRNKRKSSNRHKK